MKKLIELDEAIKVTWKDTGYTDPVNVMTAIRDRLEALPTVDAVEVVRCKDCIRFFPDDDVWGWCTVSGKMRCKDFCSYGVREDGDDAEGTIQKEWP